MIILAPIELRDYMIVLRKKGKVCSLTKQIKKQDTFQTPIHVYLKKIKF